MTREEILNMPAGEELDREIARFFKIPLWYGDPTGFEIPENVGWWRADIKDDDGEYCFRLPRFSTDIAAAWAVVEKFHENYSMQLDYDDPVTIESLKWGCVFMEKIGPYKEYEARADTAPLAICRAARLAVMELGAGE